MPRLYLPITHITDNKISITGDKVHYLYSVLRCTEGDELVIFDGEGNCFKTKIIKSGRKEVTAEVIANFPCENESHINITLVQGLLKGEKMDLVIQKATELGVTDIVPVITRRSQLRETRKISRWRKIAEEASRQSGRSVVPVIHEAVEFSDFLSASGSLHGLIFYEEEGMRLSEAVSSFKGTVLDLPQGRSAGVESGLSQNILIAIGPEGGFTKEEIDMTREKGLIVTSLGKRILRAETAAISAVSLIQFLLGDMG